RVEWRNLFYAMHRLDRPVAPLASDARKDMLAVIEVHKIGEVVDLDPSDRPLLLNSLLELLDFDGLLLQEVVTVHANPGRRNSRVAAGSRCVVAIQAGNLAIACMNLV